MVKEYFFCEPRQPQIKHYVDISWFPGWEKQQEIREWINNNLKGSWSSCVLKNMKENHGMIYAFQHEEDAAAFKLRWKL